MNINFFVEEDEGFPDIFSVFQSHSEKLHQIFIYNSNILSPMRFTLSRHFHADQVTRPRARRV